MHIECPYFPFPSYVLPPLSQGSFSPPGQSLSCSLGAASGKLPHRCQAGKLTLALSQN